MDKETKEMFNMVIRAIDESEQRINKKLDNFVTKEEMRNMYETLSHEINGVKLNTEALDMRMECVEKKVDSMDRRLTSVEKKVDSLEQKVDSMDARLSSVEQKVDSMDARLSSVEQKVDSMSLVLQETVTHESRIQDLEMEVFKNKANRRVAWQQ